MGILSNLFGRNKEQKALEKVFARIHRLLDDDEYQLEFVSPTIRDMMKSGASWDRDPNGSGPFGFSELNPIPVNGPIGQLAYLSRLETNSGQKLLFHRVGAIEGVDVFEAVTFDGREWFILFLDFYHPRRSRLAPDGFKLSKQVSQLSGFNNFCENFPYDFVERKDSLGQSDLSFAYIPLSRILQQLNDGVFSRPVAHRAKLDLVRSRLLSFQMQ
jgi:hypothetical protein